MFQYEKYDLKEELKENELIILLDFAENYTFIVQDDVQAYHWNNSDTSPYHCLQ